MVKNEETERNDALQTRVERCDVTRLTPTICQCTLYEALRVAQTFQVKGRYQRFNIE